MAGTRHDLESTIFAVAAGGRHAALTVVRLSGAGCPAILGRMGAGSLEPRRASLRSLRDGSGQLLDRALVLWFPGPRSYTGEDCAEFHLHGGGAVLDGVTGELTALGARPAEGGEFTRRAFLNGRIDLLEAEAVGDLVAAETHAQRDQALLQLQGGVGEVYAGWQGRLARVMALLEAEIDFPEDVLDSGAVQKAGIEIEAIISEITVSLSDGFAAERLRDGLVFAMVGPPNVGKSTLVNALCGRDVAIVSSAAGTTRDILEARTVLGGVPVTFLDTAGLRDTTDEVEREGVRRARDRAETADLVILVGDQDSAGWAGEAAGWSRCVRVWNKADIWSHPHEGFHVSARTGLGMNELARVLGVEAYDLARRRPVPALTRPRHRAALTDALGHLEAARSSVAAELVAEEVRLGANCLARVTSGIEPDEVLDLLFAQFCIGK